MNELYDSKFLPNFELQIEVNLDKYTIALAVTWDFDWDFIKEIENKFQLAGYSTFVIAPFNVEDVTEKIRRGQIQFDFFLDRGSDENEKFQDIAELLSGKETTIINDYSKVESAVDKSIMHQKLKQRRVKLPYTLVIPPFDILPHYELNKVNSIKLGNPFVAKPAYYSGGGEGVKLNAVSMDDVNPLRKYFHDDKYLLQKLITPKYYKSRRTWFRSFWFFNEAVPVWWDDKSHIYDTINSEDFAELDLHRLVNLTKKIAGISGLHYFSCEAAIDENNDMILIDYVNDQCDMRMKSKHADGVPEAIIDKFINKMIELVSSD